MSSRPAPAACPAPWPRELAPWKRIHIDYMQIYNRVYLVVVDAHSKWLECLDMNGNLTTKALIQKLKLLFSTFGLPEVVVSDNDPKISNDSFKEFCKYAGIIHMTSPIYHPCSNGQAENSVKTCKKMIKCIFNSADTMNCNTITDKLLTFLFEYRNTIHCTTGESPAKLMFKRELRGRLDLILPPKPHVNPTDETVNLAKTRLFRKGQKIWVKCFVAQKPVWKIGHIIDGIGKRMFNVMVDNIELKRHVDQLIRYTGDASSPQCNLSVNQGSSQAEHGRSDNARGGKCDDNECSYTGAPSECESIPDIETSAAPLTIGDRDRASLCAGTSTAVQLLGDDTAAAAAPTLSQIPADPPQRRYLLRPKNKAVNYKM